MILFFFQPIERSESDEVTIASGLKALRNKIAFGLLLINGLLVLVIYLLQMHKDILSITWGKEIDQDEF